MNKEDLFVLNGAGVVSKETLMFLKNLSDSTFDQNVRDKIGAVLTGAGVYYDGYDADKIRNLFGLKCAATNDSRL